MFAQDQGTQIQQNAQLDLSVLQLGKPSPTPTYLSPRKHDQGTTMEVVHLHAYMQCAGKFSVTLSELNAFSCASPTPTQKTRATDCEVGRFSRLRWHKLLIN